MPHRTRRILSNFFGDILTFGCSKSFWEENSKIRLLEDFSNSVANVCAKFEGCGAKTAGGVGFLGVTGFLKKTTIAKFRLTAGSLMGQTSNLANIPSKNL